MRPGPRSEWLILGASAAGIALAAWAWIGASHSEGPAPIERIESIAKAPEPAPAPPSPRPSETPTASTPSSGTGLCASGSAQAAWTEMASDLGEGELTLRRHLVRGPGNDAEAWTIEQVGRPPGVRVSLTSPRSKPVVMGVQAEFMDWARLVREYGDRPPLDALGVAAPYLIEERRTYGSERNYAFFANGVAVELRVSRLALKSHPGRDAIHCAADGCRCSDEP